MEEKLFKIETPEQITSFLEGCGFVLLVCGGCPQYVKEISNDDFYSFQINAPELAIIDSADEEFVFSENGKDPSVTPLPRYVKTYPNFKSMILGEMHRDCFSKTTNKV